MSLEQNEIEPVCKNDNLERIFFNQIKKDFNKLIEEFSEEKKSALFLRDIEGFDYANIGKILNLPIGTVKALIHRGREVIYKKLRRRYD